MSKNLYMKSFYFSLLFLLGLGGQFDSTIIFRSHGYDYLISDLPQGYKPYFVISGNCSTIFFEYEDSSQVYICSNHEYSPNMRNILSAPPVEKKNFRINWYLNMALYEELVLSTDKDSATNYFLDSPYMNGDFTMRDFFSIGSDTIDLCEKSEDGKYWRDIITPDGYCYGYLNVDESSRQHFDKAISTVTRASKIENFSGQIYSDQ